MNTRNIRWMVSVIAVALLIGACAGSNSTGVAETNAGSATSAAGDSTTSIVDDTSTTGDDGTTTTADESEDTTTTPPTTAAPTTARPTTAPATPLGLPTPDDVAHQYDTLCLQSHSRDLVEKWFEPGVLDDLGCRQSDEAPQGFVENFGCEPIPDAAGAISHGCFFWYEGGGYTILVGDLGGGYRGLGATFVID